MIRLLLIITAILLVGCGAGRPFIQPDPEVIGTEDGVDLTTEDTSITTTDSLAEIISEEETSEDASTQEESQIAPKPIIPDTPPIEGNWVRISLKKSLKTVTLFGYGRMRIQSPHKRITVSSGTLRFYAEGSQVKVSAHGKSALIMLPCTLSIVAGKSMWDVDDKQYRGRIILSEDKNSSLHCINYLPVETYLRGVVPLEIGQKGKRDMEALKAQAIAARTYTYKKIEANRYPDFDMFPTVSDQVYGGAGAEYLLTDKAIEETESMVMFYRGELVDAFYHSTCGGRTSNVHEVWGSSPKGYLKSRSDLKPDGSAYCAISPVYYWNEAWSLDRFSDIIGRHSQKLNNITPISGMIRNVGVQERTSSGRVKKALITTSSGSYIYGGDKIRFLFRRDVSGESILRSAFFSISVQGGMVTAKGRGFGHGIGMCQMGALGRARHGQDYEDILKAYYSGVDIKPIGDLHGSKK